MRKVSVFNFVTLNGYYKDSSGNISWHTHNEEEAEFSMESLQSGNLLLFGRVTYQMMASYWPTAMAMENDPIVAKGMNEADKIVFSKTLKMAEWSNTKVIKNDVVEEVRKMKHQSGRDITVLGSGNILTQLAQHNLIDEYQIMVDPAAVGNGTPMFKGLQRQLNLKHTKTRVFRSGSVLLCYEPLR